MDEILELQRQLALAQQGTAAQKLSDRNCVELVMKLQSLNLIELIFTRTGKEYLTPAQLNLEIRDEVLARGGRVNIIDLPDALNVNLSYIESQLPQILDEETQLIRGEILTDYYLNSLAEEVNDSLSASETGTDSVGSIATRYSLPVSIIQSTISSHIGTTIHATLDDSGVLRSFASIARHRAAARGLLRALSAPTNIADLAQAHALQTTLLLEVANEMIATTRISGTISGRSRPVFTPRVFSDAATAAVVSTFTSDGFISYDKLSASYIPDVDTFIDQRLEGCLKFANCVVSPVLVDTLATSASEALENSSWLDIVTALPANFPPDDVGDIVQKLSSTLEEPGAEKESGKTARRRKGKTTGSKDDKKKLPRVFGDRFVVSEAFTERYSKLIVADADAKAIQRAKLMTERMAMIVSHTETTTEARAQTEVKKTKGKGRRRAGAKDKNTSRANGGDKGIDNDQSEFAVVVPSVDEILEIVLADKELLDVCETDYLGSSTAGDDMLTFVLEGVYGEDGLDGLYNSHAAEAIVDLERQRAIAKTNGDKAILAGLENAELYYKSAESVASEELVESSRSHVIDVICVNVLCKIVDSVAQSTGIIHAGLAEVESLKTKREKVELLREATAKLAPTLQSAIRSLMTFVSDKDVASVDSFLAQYDESIALLDLPERRALDKKSEKSAHANARAMLTSRLDKVEVLAGAQVLEICTALVHAKSHGGCIVAIAEDSVIDMCIETEENAKPAEAGVCLRKMRACLEEKYDEWRNASAGFPDGLLEHMRELREFIG